MGNVGGSNAGETARNRLGWRGQNGIVGLLALTLIAVILVVIPTRAGGALPVPALFQLDGNATTQAADGPGDDWDKVFAGTSSAFSSGFIPESVEGASVDTTYFTTGQKDSFDIPQWQPCGNSAPPKDELNNVMAAAYLDPSNQHTILYFGADRQSTNGDSNIGFWFNQDPNFGLSGTCPNQSFTGVHQNGDLFVVSAFTNGGAQPTVDIYQWQNGALNTTPIASGESDCSTEPNGNPACAIVNKTTIPVPWTYNGNTPGSVSTNGFFEGGIDLSQIAGPNVQIPCFTSFLGETRSSQTLSATVKDFALGNVNSCGTIQLKKHWVGPAGNTTINIGKTAGASDVATANANGADAATPVKSVNPGTYHVSETTLRNSSTTSPPGGYTTSLSCVNNKDPQNPKTVTTTAEDGSVPAGSQGDSLSVTSGDAIVCTYTNTFIKQISGTTTHSSTTSTTVVPGTSVTDTATVTGVAGGPAPTGDGSTTGVTFFLCQPNQVVSHACPAGAGTQVGGLVALTATNPQVSPPTASGTSGSSTNTTAIGEYCWRAVYTGDVYYNGSNGTAANECFTTVKQTSGTTTHSSTTSTTVVPGTSVSDTATVAGISGGPAPTGDGSTTGVTFFLCQPNEVVSDACPAGAGTQVGGRVALTATNPQVNPPTASGTSGSSSNTLAIGEYCWRAVYTGDSFYNGSNGTAASECFTTVKQTSGTTTHSSTTSTTVVPGTSVSDTATVAGISGGPAPTGNGTTTGVRFFLCQPNEVVSDACPAGAGTQVGGLVSLTATNPQVDPPTASGTSGSSSNTTAIGEYCWRAVYTGDSFYNGSNGTAANECFTTAKQTAGTTTHSSTTSTTVVPGTTVSDTATVTGISGGPAPTGNGTTTGVRFFLCQPNEVVSDACPAGAGTQIGGLVALTATTPQVNPPTASGPSGTSSNTLAIGEYCWRAVYTGDSFYNGSNGTAANECFTTVKQTSGTTTHSSTTSTTVVPGTSVSDTATVAGISGGPAPTGNGATTGVTFFLCQPNEVVSDACPAGAGTQIGGLVALTATNPQVDPPTATAPSSSSSNTLAIGEYCWRAVYTGDSFYNNSNGTAANECFTTVKQTSGTTTHSSTTSTTVVPGTSVSDTATVAGISGGPAPTGNGTTTGVTFFLCQPNEVVSDACPAGAGTQIGGLVALTATNPQVNPPTAAGTSGSSSNTLAIGEYCWRAVYTGDSFYNGSNGTAANECFTTVKQTSSTDTTSSPTGGGVVPGTQVSDSATVSGIEGGPTPTGTVDFFLCDPTAVAANPNGDCATGGTKVGASKTLVNGSVTSDSTTSAATLAIGKYCWRAVYSGDSFYNGSNHTNSTSECFVTGKQISSTDTLSAPHSDTVVPGTQPQDNATVTGIQTGPTPTGTVTFFLCGPDPDLANDNTAGGCTTGGTQVGGAITLIPGSGQPPTATAQSALGGTNLTNTIGKYCWRAVYSGDGFYLGSSHTDPTNECFTTVKQPSSTDTTSSPTGLTGVVPGTSASDSATVSGGQGQPTPTGTVDFFLCQPSEVTLFGCEVGGTKIGATKTLSGGQATSDATVNTTAIGTYCWRAEYSGDAFYLASSHTNHASECFVTVKQPASVATVVKDGSGHTVSSGSPAALGTAVHDTATLGGGLAGLPLGDGATGNPNSATVKYEFFGTIDCSGTHTDQTVTVAGNGTVPDATPTAGLGAGNYSYFAIYSGNAFYLASSSTPTPSTCEPFVINKGTPSASTTLHNASGGGMIANGTALDNGSGVFDTAQITTTDSFTLTGTVTFQFFTNGGCTGTAASTQSGVALTSGNATSSSQTNLGPGSYSFNAQYVAGSDPNHLNSAVSSCEPFSVNSPPPPPPSTPQNPSIAITKNPKSQSILTGQTATFTIVVTNTGNVTLTNVTVTDQLSPDCNKTSAQIGGLASMAPGASVTYNCSLSNVQASFTNVAVATGTPPSGSNVTAQDSAPVTVNAPLTPPPTPTPTHPAIDIVKDPKTQTIGQGGKATFNITVTNTGDVTLTDVTVDDPLSTDCNRNLGTLAVGQSKNYTCTKDNVTADFQNVATATGKPPTGAKVSAKDNADIAVKPFIPPQHPHIAIVKSPKHQTVTTKLSTSTTAAGANKTTVSYGTATFTIKVTNNGDVALHNVTVSDPLSTNCNKNIGTLAAGASTSYTCTKPAVTANYTNVATATGTSPKGVTVHATDHADVTVTTKTTSTSGAKFTG
jgi:uncharacterized repeat protein (TIGR01451 family)